MTPCFALLHFPGSALHGPLLRCRVLRAGCPGWSLGRGQAVLGFGVAKHLQVLRQHPAFFRTEGAADHAVLSAAVAEFMTTVAIAGGTGAKGKTAGEFLNAESNEFRIEFEGADVGLRQTFGGREEQLK